MLLFYSSPGNYNWLLLDTSALTPTPLNASWELGKGDSEERCRELDLDCFLLNSGGIAAMGIRSAVSGCL